MRQLLKCLFLSILFLYNQFGYSQKTFSPSELISDVDSLNKKILEIHPNPFSKIDSLSYYNDIRSLKKSLNKPLTSLAFYKLLSPVIRKIGDGHTGLQPNQAEMNITKLPFPIYVYIKNGHLFVKKNCSSNNSIIIGSEILKINNISGQEIVSTLMEYTEGEFEERRIALRQSSLRFPTSSLQRHLNGNRSTPPIG